MRQEPVWRYGPKNRYIYQRLHQLECYIIDSADVYLSKEDFDVTGIRNLSLDLDGGDEFFQCMSEEDLSKLRPLDPTEPFVPYEKVRPPGSSPPLAPLQKRDCAAQIEFWFHELHTSKVASDGHGCVWPEEGSCWVPREMRDYEEELYSGCIIPPSIPYSLFRAFMCMSDKPFPHQIFSATHADDGEDGVLSRNELKIFLSVMKGRMREAIYCMHIPPVLMLSIHSSKARIMIAHFDRCNDRLVIKSSPYVQFDGYGAAGETRPKDFDKQKDLFFRWMNPICHGNTYIEDPEYGPELVMRKVKGRKRMVERVKRSALSSTTSSESIWEVEGKKDVVRRLAESEKSSTTSDENLE